MPRFGDDDLETLVAQLNEGTPDERGQAAEKLFNKAADDEEARQNAAAVGAIQPLVGMQPCCMIIPGTGNMLTLLDLLYTASSL